MSQMSAGNGRGGLRRWARAPRILIAALAVLVVASGFTWTIHKLVTRPASLCAPAAESFKVFRYDGECVGTTSGGYVFAPALRGVEHDIAVENARAVASGHFVSVALLTPLTIGPGSLVSLARIQDELDGAYAAQYAANSSGLGPPIQLLLANEGATEQAWRPVVGQLTSPAARAAHLVAVIGMGLSTTQTVDGARALHQAGLPMVGSVFTADSLDWAHINGLVHVMPDIAQQAAALHAYLAARHLLGHLFLVSDTDSSDLYSEGLGTDFSKDFRSSGSQIPNAQYGPPQSQEAGLLSTIVTSVCPVKPTAAPPVVLFAGREVLLPAFLSSLRGTADCQDKQVTVVTESDAAALSPSVTAPVTGDGGLTVIYSDLVNPGLVTAVTKQVFRASRLRSAASLSGTWTIATYDAMAAAAKAIVLGATHDHGRLPTPSLLYYDLRLLHGRNQVSGATGLLGISEAGDPVDPQVPIMKLAGGAAPIAQPG
jgi:ABC-type branched-subunit amino acid transport system substrate-binding protein